MRAHATFEPLTTRGDPVELLEFSKAYAAQNERDFRRLAAAADSGELVAQPGNDELTTTAALRAARQEIQ